MYGLSIEDYFRCTFCHCFHRRSVKDIQCHSSIGVSPHKHKGCPTKELPQAYRPKSFRCFEQQLEHICSFLLLFIGNAVIFCIFFRWEFLHFGRCIKDAKYQDECSDIERIDDRIRHDSLGGDIADTDCREDKRKQISCQTSCITKETLNGIGKSFLLLVDHIAYHHFKRLHSHIDGSIEKHQRYQAKNHGGTDTHSEASRIRQQAHDTHRNECPHKQVRNTSSETCPGAVAQSTDDRLYDDSCQWWKNPKVT